MDITVITLLRNLRPHRPPPRNKMDTLTVTRAATLPPHPPIPNMIGTTVTTTTMVATHRVEMTMPMTHRAMSGATKRVLTMKTTIRKKTAVPMKKNLKNL